MEPRGSQVTSGSKRDPRPVGRPRWETVETLLRRPTLRAHDLELLVNSIQHIDDLRRKS